MVVRSDAVAAAAAAGGAAPSVGSSADSFDVSPSLVVLPDAPAAASAGGEQRRGQGTLIGLGGSVMSKGGASQLVEAAGERNEFNRRQDRFLCMLPVVRPVEYSRGVFYAQGGERVQIPEGRAYVIFLYQAYHLLKKIKSTQMSTCQTDSRFGFLGHSSRNS